MIVVARSARPQLPTWISAVVWVAVALVLGGASVDLVVSVAPDAPGATDTVRELVARQAVRNVAVALALVVAVKGREQLLLGALLLVWAVMVLGDGVTATITPSYAVGGFELPATLNVALSVLYGVTAVVLLREALRSPL